VVAAGDGVGGLLLRIDESHRVDLEVEAGRVSAVVQVGALRSVLGSVDVAAGDITLELRTVPDVGHVSSTALGPDRFVARVVPVHGRT